MGMLRHSVTATAFAAIAVLVGGNAFAQETTTSTTTSPSTSTQTTPPPAQAVTVQQPAPQPVQVTQPAQPVATTQTTSAPYVDPSDRERERSIEHRPNKTLLSTGAGIFILSYGASVIAAAASSRDADNKLFIPLVGPWMDLADRGCTLATPCGSSEDVAKAMIITSGIVQSAGVLLALGSLVIPESTTVTDRTTTAKTEKKPTVSVLPVSYAAGAGVGAVGTF
jgi:hypothetical protein